ncbi:hypothetical protein [Stenotrophomonas sp. 24(2023)]|uniref:hypothetical protein n=1 Tax=Stenotrophomonas sp. 24(2023) TaxID=3068324 RepID=UPI0027E009F4|nr:hypothetical protein [Stenotrophomonas sp. 24(2023)]WMJ68827.1 hypothetical protein Q9R17_16830 [Stenotrophomonas sp. 24(2023)]
MTDVTQQRSLRELVGPVGAAYQQRALPPGWVWALLSLTLLAACLAALPAIAATALLASAVVVHWPRRNQAQWMGWRVFGLAVLALAAWGPDVLALWFEHGLALVLMALAGTSVLAYVHQSRQMARQLQCAADAMDDGQLMALLPADAAQMARQWREGDDRHAPELAVVMHLAVMHAALAPRCQRRMLAG